MTEAKEVQTKKRKESLWKVYFLMLVTFTLYHLVWFFRNGKKLKEELKLNWNIGWRTAGLLVPFLSLWFLYQLFDEADKLAKKNGARKSIEPGGLVLFYVFLNIIVFTLLNPESSSLVITILNIIFFIVMPILFVIVQRSLNYSWNKINPKEKCQRIAWWEILILIFGGIFFLLAILGLFLPA